jgi:hypothetical protein
MLEIVESYFSGVLTVLQLLFFIKCSLDKKINLSKKSLLIIIAVLAAGYSYVFLNIEGVFKSLSVAIVSMFICKFLYKVSFKTNR